MKYQKELQTFLGTPSDKPKIIVIYGPTGSWKTDMSIDIAKQLGTEIISTDSRQIFKYMDIGTGKITPEEMQWVPHHMLDIVTPDQEYSVWDFKRGAIEVIDRLHAETKIPMLVWWTALYIDSLIYDFALEESSNKDEILRAELEKVLAEKWPEALYKILQDIDPDYAPEIHPNNARYVMRAIEVKKLTGKSKGEFRGDREPIYDVLFLTPYTWDREALYERINKREEQIVRGWLIDEVQSLLDMWYDKNSFGMKSIWYEEVLSYLDGEIFLEEAISQVQQNSRRYAKRQLTRFRKYTS